MELRTEDKKEFAALTYRDRTLLGVRQEHNTRGKEEIAVALCQILASGLGKEEIIASQSLRDRLMGKFEAVRSKLNYAMAVDAGTSTFTFVEQFMNDPAVAAGRLVRPRIITNSTPIAEMVRMHHHRRDVSLVLVGGEMRVDHGSICGTLADMCLQKWDSHVDLAVVGTTAYNPAFHGSPAFGCDNVAEARLKSAMLESSMLRVVLLDSSKIVSKTSKQRSIPHQHFCVLHENSLDLVIVDNRKHSAQEFTEFTAACHHAKVACLVADQKNG